MGEGVPRINARSVPHYDEISDGDNFLTKLDCLKSNIEPGTLVTFDVESLYTNISSELACEALRYWLNKECGKLTVDKGFIVESVELILKNNIFFFDSEFFDKHVALLWKQKWRHHW